MFFFLTHQITNGKGEENCDMMIVKILCNKTCLMQQGHYLQNTYHFKILHKKR